MRRASILLSMVLGMLAARGLAAEALDSWRAWVVFKHFARVAHETPDPGVSVQIQRAPDEARLYLIRQVLEPDRDQDWLRPVGGVVCELSFSEPPATVRDFAVWSFDHGSFERFVDHVEGDAGFADLIARRPTLSDVYWLDA